MSSFTTDPVDSTSEGQILELREVHHAIQNMTVPVVTKILGAHPDLQVA